jgi:hypothetical protein
MIDVEIQPGSAPDAAAAAIAGALRQVGYDGQSIMLAIPSAWSLCAPIETAGLPARNRQLALAYRLEDQLPIAAEELIVDFLPFEPADPQTLGISAQKSQLLPVVESLESSGVAVGSICPLALLAAEQLLSQGLPEVISADAAAWPSDQPGVLELFILQNARVVKWHSLPDEPGDLLLHLAIEFRGDQNGIRKFLGVNLRPEIFAALSTHASLIVTASESPDPLHAAASMAGSILAGRAVPWIELRRGDLAVKDPLRQVRTPLTWAAAALVICTLAVCGGMLWRANRFDQLAARDADRQQAIFRQVFQNDPLPVDVRSRLAAEERGLHGLTGDTSSPAAAENGLVILRDLILHLPAADELRYRVLELRLDLQHFAIEGQAAGHGDADRIVAALRRGGAFTVEPPRTEQLAGSATTEEAGLTGNGVAFTITGQRAAK